MNKHRSFYIFLFCIITISSVAQPLNGYVKTKGRLSEDGSVVPGKPLSGVMIQIKGYNPVFTNEEGKFSIIMPNIREGDAYYIDNIRKSGYVLVDNELLNKRIAFSSKTPLVVVMDSINTLLEERLQIERKLRCSLQRRLRQKEDEFEQLLNHGTITKEEYTKKIQELYEQIDNNEKLLSQMTEHYSQIDYEQTDEYQRIISEYILAGELEKADSILNVRGGLTQRIESILQKQIDDREEERMLDETIIGLEEAGNRLKMEMISLANDINNIVDRFKMTMQYDSVVYYLGLKSNLDTTNVRWNIDAGAFIVDYCFNYRTERQSFSFFQRALNSISEQTESTDIASTYIGIGNYYCEQGNFRQALDSYKIALEYISNEGSGYAQCVEKIAIVYNSMKRYEESKKFHLLSIETFTNLKGENCKEVAQCCNNLGAVFENMGDSQLSEEYFSKAIRIWTEIYGSNHISSDIAICYNNLGGVYDKKADYNQAIAYYLQSIKTYIDLGRNPDKDLNIACVYNNLGSTYYNKGDYVNAITSFGRALRIMRQTRDTTHPDVRAILENISVVVEEMSK